MSYYFVLYIIYFCVYTYMCGERHWERNFKELARVIAEDGKSKICRIGWQAGDPGEMLTLQFKSEGGLLAEFLLDQAYPH